MSFTDAGEPRLDAGHDAAVPDAGPLGPQPWICETADAGEPGPGACERDVEAGLILPNDPGCFVDVIPAAGEIGKLRWDCSQDAGNAELVFARATFHGAFAGDRVTVCVGTSYLFGDNCTWLSAQHIAGSLASDAGLGFHYAESPAPGQTGCWIPCVANGPLDYP